MPLQSGTSRSVFANNYDELKQSGYSNPKQRVAIVLSNARRHPDGGEPPAGPHGSNEGATIGGGGKFNRKSKSVFAGTKF